MAKYRKRFNEKARAGQVARQEELKRARNPHLYQDEGPTGTDQPDSNAEVMMPGTKQEKETRRQKMAEELKRDAPGMSSKKRKRLDNYIDRQIRKQETAELIDKISKNHVETEGLQSLKTLGSGTKQTKRQKLEEAIDLERQGRGDENTKELLYEEHEVKDWRDAEEFKDYKEPEPEPQTSSSFVDNRPATPAMGFGFSNLPKVAKASKPKYNWRAKLAEQNERKYGKSEDKASYFRQQDDSDSGSDSGSSSDSEEDEEEESDEDNEEDEGEWGGFSDTDVKNQVPESSSEEESEESESEEDEGDEPHQKGRGAEFRKWAQLQQGLSDDPRQIESLEFKHLKENIERPEDVEAPTSEMQIHESDRKAEFVTVNRPEALQEARLALPVVGEEHRIMDAINNNDTVVICGETGSGKTTQVPQFLFESGYANHGMIGVTQPRRVAAVSMAKRVGVELADHGHKVGYQIRFDARVNEQTAVKFMTDGVLLKEMSKDIMLPQYSVVVIDEAHERNINTDILIGMLSRVMRLRKTEGETPLKLVIMSATLRVSDFTENTRLFPIPPPVLKVEARQHPVSVHFNRRTQFEYLDAAYDKAVKIHQKLPPGGILIFLTGQNEITGMVKKLRKAFPAKQQKIVEEDVRVRISAKEATTEVEDVEFGLDNIEEMKNEQEDDDYAESDEEEEGFDEELEEGQDANAPMHVLPLYSLLPTKDQMKVFEAPPDGSRLVVVATNVAETSLTIPGIRYVVDCGRSKERHFDEATGVQSFKIGWTSKASANQRSGRAGRTGPGHCYRIYSSAVYENDFEQFTKPEIERMPIEGIVLQMKSMLIDNIVNFPFPSPPPPSALQKGISLLKYLGALDGKDMITDLGRNMSLFPLSPRYSKMLLIGNQQDCLAYVVAIVAGLTVGDPFIGQHELGLDKEDDEDDDDTVEDKEFKRRLRGNYYKAMAKFSALDDNSDALKMLCAVCAYEYEQSDQFIKENFLRAKTMEEIVKLRKQVAYIVAANTKEKSVEKTTERLNARLAPPSKTQIKALKQMVTAGFIDQVAIRADLVAEIDKPTRTITYPYASLFPSTFNTLEDDPYVYIHPNSVLAESGEKPPDYLVFSAMSQSEPGKKIRIRPLCDVTGAQLANVSKGSALLTYSKPLGPPYGPKTLSATKRECWVVPRMGAAIGTGGVGWDLPVAKVIQIKTGSNWVVQ